MKLLQGNNMDLLRTLEANSIDSIVTCLKLRYDVTKSGEVINIRRNKEVKFSKDKKGYLKARLYCPEVSNSLDKRISFRLHRLVAMFYLKDFSKNLQVNHKDGIKTNNELDNLEMMTCSQNVYHGWNVLDSTSRKNNLKRDESGKFVKG